MTYKIYDAWTSKEQFGNPQFPIVYFECIGALECRGFLDLQDVIGDIDFSGYSGRGEDIIIDSKCRVYSLGFKSYIYPQRLIDKITKKDFARFLFPMLVFQNRKDLIEFIKHEDSCESIIMKMAIEFAW